MSDLDRGNCCPAGLFLQLGRVGDQRLGRDWQRGDGCRILQSRTLGPTDDIGRHQILGLTGLRAAASLPPLQ